MTLTFQLYLNDENKPTDTKVNLRPVAVSDVSPNVNTRKNSSSCAHAVIVLRQIIKYARMINKRVYMFALDASKSFDKVIRRVL